MVDTRAALNILKESKLPKQFEFSDITQIIDPRTSKKDLEALLTAREWNILDINRLLSSNLPRSSKVSIFNSLSKTKTTPNTTSFNSMIRTFVNDPSTAQAYFDRINECGLTPDQNSYALIIEAWAFFGEKVKAAFYFDQIQKKGFKPGTTVYAAMLLFYPEREDSYRKQIQELGLKITDSWYNSIIRAHSKLGNIKKAESAYQSLLENFTPTRKTYEYMIRACQSSPKKAEYYFKEMNEHGVEPGTKEYFNLLDILYENGLYKVATDYLDDMKRKKIPADSNTRRISLKLQMGKDLVSNIPSSVRSCNMILRELSRRKLSAEADAMFEKMTTNNIEPNIYTFEALVKTNRNNPRKAEYYFNMIPKWGLQPNSFVYDTFLLGLQSKDRKKLIHYFGKMRESGLLSSFAITCMIEGDPSRAGFYFSLHNDDQLKPSIHTLRALLKCKKTAMLDHRECWKKAIQIGIKPDLQMYTTMVKMYGMHYFTEMQKNRPDLKLDSTIYNVVIQKLLIVGKFDEAVSYLKLFEPTISTVGVFLSYHPDKEKFIDMGRKLGLDTRTYNILISHYLNKGDLSRVAQFYCELSSSDNPKVAPNANTFTTLIGYAKDEKTAMSYLTQAERRNIIPDSFMLKQLLKHVPAATVVRLIQKYKVDADS